MNNQIDKHMESTAKRIQLLLVMLFSVYLVSCESDKDIAPVLAEPTIDKVEVGLSNNEIGVIGRDFHLNAEVLAGDKIDLVQVKIQQRPGEAYAKTWSYEVTWEQYKGAKNATVHKHFDIPSDAAEGKYDFLIIVTDENGRRLEAKRAITLYQEANLPVSPQLAHFTVFTNDEDLPFYDSGAFKPGAKLKRNDKFVSLATISGVKGDGKMYLLLIDKKLNHRPESIEQIDFKKAIVYDVYEHQNMEKPGDFSNNVFDMATYTIVRGWPNLTIGAATDNNTPTPNPISGTKAWETGTYYYGVVYQNTTYNMSFFHYIEVPVEIN